MELAIEKPKRSFADRFLRPLLIPALAVFTALLIGAIVIVVTAENPLVGLEKVAIGYWGIIDGALLSTRGLTNTMVAMTPLILTGLAVAIPFRAGMFNIGGEGQFTIGALCGALAGIYLNLPPGLHVLVTLLAGLAGGMLLGFIPGVLKAWLGSHEVINTIMLNYIALYIANMVVREVIRDPKPSTLQSLPLRESAYLLHLTGRLHLGFFVAILMAVLAWFFLFKTTWGFSFRTTGQNPSAASYAGIRPKLEYVLAMVLGGALAALAGTIEVQGLSHVLTTGYAFGYGFDGIAVSLLALNHPLAVIPAAFVFAILRIGGDFLQIRAGLSVHIVSILQALILLFVAAPAIIRYLYRLKVTYRAGEEGGPLTSGWGS